MTDEDKIKALVLAVAQRDATIEDLQGSVHWRDEAIARGKRRAQLRLIFGYGAGIAIASFIALAVDQ